MADEAVQYHDFPRARIYQTGAAQFDNYYRARETTDIAQWRDMHDVPRNAFLMMYGTINPGICGHEIEILRSIIARMRASDLPRRPFLWIRLHPQVVNGSWESSVEPFRSLAADDVRVEIPPVTDSKLHWDLPRRDAEHLRSLITASDMVITTSSTLSIDAACADTPITNVFFDGCKVDPALSVSRFKNYTHYSKILATGGIFIADTPEQFSLAMEHYCDNRKADHVGRLSIIRQQIGSLDGCAGINTARVLMMLANKTPLTTESNCDVLPNRA